LQASNHLQGVQSLICIKIAPPGWIIVILQFSGHLTDEPAVASMQAIAYPGLEKAARRGQTPLEQAMAALQSTAGR
jgi:hypothetical protein